MRPGKQRVRRDVENTYQSMSVGKGGSLRRRQAKKKTSTGTDIYYVDPSALLPDGTVISCSDRWQYYISSQLKGFPFFGKLGTYSGGGYVANLGYNEETGWTVIADLHAHKWIDRQTRAVFVEFTVYNANANLFATATGGSFPHSDFKILIMDMDML